jgi:GntR family transcriptional regulator
MREKVLKYSVVKHRIIEMIDSEECKVDSLIPSERELMDMFQVSRITVRKAIDDLVNEGYLYRIQGKGTYVKNDKISHDLFSITSCTEEIRSCGMVASSRVISFEAIPVDRYISKLLQISDNSLVMRLERIFYANNKPINYTITYLPLSIFPGFEKHDFEKESLYSVIENTYGIKITHAKRTLEAILANEENSKYLKIEPGKPLILFRCETYGEIEGREVVIESFKCYYRTDKHKFYINQIR